MHEPQPDGEQARLTRAEERMRSIVDHVVDGIISIDERGKVTTFNRAAERIFGYTAAEAIGQNVRMLMPGSSLRRPIFSHTRVMAMA